MFVVWFIVINAQTSGRQVPRIIRCRWDWVRVSYWDLKVFERKRADVEPECDSLVCEYEPLDFEYEGFNYRLMLELSRVKK
jgi:hypothetical protein